MSSRPSSFLAGGSRPTPWNNAGLQPHNRSRSQPNLPATHTTEYGRPVYLDDAILKKVRENQSKFIQDRISKVESHFGDMCQSFASYTRKLGRLRDKGDEVSRSVVSYSEHETLNRTTQTALVEFGQNMAAIQDYRETEIKRIEAKVIQPLTLYGAACKHAKERLKSAFAARDKEMKQKRTLDKVKDRSPSNRAEISLAETELQKASVDASWSSKALEEEMDSFERKKLADIKRILFDYVNIELLFHAKSLELYSQMHRNLSSMSEEEDLEEFRNSLRPNSTATRMEMAAMASGSRTSLNTTGAMNTTGMSGMSGMTAASRGTGTPTATPTVNRHRSDNDHNNLNTLGSTNPSSMYSTTTAEDDDDDDDEDDDEDDDDDDDDDEDDTTANDSYAHHFTAKSAATNSRRT